MKPTKVRLVEGWDEETERRCNRSLQGYAGFETEPELELKAGGLLYPVPNPLKLQRSGNEPDGRAQEAGERMSEVMIWRYSPSDVAALIAADGPRYVLALEGDLSVIEQALCIDILKPGVSFERGLKPLIAAGIPIDEPDFYISATPVSLAQWRARDD